MARGREWTYAASDPIIVMMVEIQRVQKVQLWSVCKIAIVATLLAACAFTILYGLFLLIRISFSPPWALIVVFYVFSASLIFLLPAAVAIAYHPQFRNWWHGFLFGGVYGSAILALPLLFLQPGRTAMALQNDPIGLVTDCVLPAAVAFGVGGLLFVLLWTASRKSRGKLQVRDGTCCPECGYNLIGNTTSICSECGRSFTLEDLDITAEDLKPF